MNLAEKMGIEKKDGVYTFEIGIKIPFAEDVAESASSLLRLIQSSRSYMLRELDKKIALLLDEENKHQEPEERFGK